MEYQGGTHLAKLQWNMIHAPGLVIGIFEKDGDGKSHRVKDITAFLNWVKEKLGKKDITYNKEQFYDGLVVKDYAVLAGDIKLYVEFGKSGIIDLPKDEKGRYSVINISFSLNNRFHNGFYFKIPYKNSDKTAIKIWCYSYEDFEKLLNYFGLEITKPSKEYIIELYKESLTQAQNDCDKLDVIYETIPEFVTQALGNDELYQALQSIGNCYVGNHKFLKLFAPDTDEETAIINILKGFDNKWIYNKINKDPSFFEKLLRSKIGFSSSKIDEIAQLIIKIAADNWVDTDLHAKDYVFVEAKRVNTQTEYSILSKLGLADQIGILDEEVIISGCVPKELGSYNFGNQILIESPIITGGSVFGCTGNIEKRALEPIIVSDSQGQEFILPAVLAKYYLEDSHNKGIKEAINNHITILLPEVLIKPITFTKWSKFFRAKSGNAIKESLFFKDDLVKEIRSSIELDKVLQKQFSQLSIDELTAIKVYTSEEPSNKILLYAELNKELRANNVSEFYKEFRDLLNSGLSKLSKPDTKALYRGIRGQEALTAENYIIDEVISFNDFKSTSISIEKAFNFTDQDEINIMYKITNAESYDICRISCLPNEMENLLKGGSRFRVKNINTNYKIRDTNDEEQIVYLIELDFIR